jgi:hypothetical protein
VAHRQRRVQKPDRRAQIPDPVEIAAHSLMGCVPKDARPLSLPIVKGQF